MKRRRFILGTGATAAGAGLLVGSGAFSRVESQRAVTIDIVGDDDAYLRLVYEDAVIDDCEGTITLVTIRNQLKHPLTVNDVELEYDDDHLTIEDIELPDPLDPGEEGEVKLTVSCTTPEEETSTIAFTIDTSEDLGGVIAQDRAIDVTCWCPLEDETFWGYGGEKTEGTADDSEDNPLNGLDGITKWGWYFEFNREDVELGVDLWAAAGQNDLDKGYHVGTASVEEVEENELLVTYELDASLDDNVTIVQLEEAHLYVDKDTDRLADIAAAPGQLGYENTTGVFEVDLTDVQVKGEPNIDVSDADTLVIAAHGVAGIHVDD